MTNVLPDRGPIANPSFIIIGADAPWVHSLCVALAKVGSQVNALRFVGFRNSAMRRSPSCAFHDRLTERAIHVPPAFGTRLHLLTRNYLQAVLERAAAEVSSKTGQLPWIVVTHPVAERWTRRLPESRLIYWNYDEYTLYQPKRAVQIREWEDTLIERASYVLCASAFQQSKFIARFPAYRGKVLHFPNATRIEWIGPMETAKPMPNTVGYIGNLGERVDWQLVYETIKGCSDLEFVFVGSLEDKGEPGKEWPRWREKVLAFANVRCTGYAQQDDVGALYHSFAVNWIPYDWEHPFNVAACPTKIFDALATGRPLVSTSVPECRLYERQIVIANEASKMIEALRAAVVDMSSLAESERVSLAVKNSWDVRALSLISTVTKQDVSIQNAPSVRAGSPF